VDVCIFTERQKERSVVIWQCTVSNRLVVKKGRSRWFRHVEGKNDADWVCQYNWMEPDREDSEDVFRCPIGMV